VSVANPGKCALTFNVFDQSENLSVELLSRNYRVSLTNEFLEEIEKFPDLKYKIVT